MANRGFTLTDFLKEEAFGGMSPAGPIRGSGMGLPVSIAFGFAVLHAASGEIGAVP